VAKLLTIVAYVQPEVEFIIVGSICGHGGGSTSKSSSVCCRPPTELRTKSERRADPCELHAMKKVHRKTSKSLLNVLLPDAIIIFIFYYVLGS
jgi:hypothetical protein